MCGFVALAGADACAPRSLEAGLNAILHRGPDGRGLWRSADGRAALGHARLSIIDLSDAGAQPMGTADGRAFIAYNGEVFNFRELSHRLDVNLKSQSDTEVVLELLRKYGVAAVQFLRGMFSFAYWDGEELLLVRDRLGIKPLFYAEGEDRIVAGSEIAAVLAMRRTSPRIDGRAIDDYLTYLYVPPPRTGVLGVHELPPGHWLRWRRGGASVIERYWTVPSQTSSSDARPARVRTLLEDSVRSSLVSDAPVGVFLSGGLDSSTIVALASRHYPGTLKTFTVTFGEEAKHLDESNFAREVATRFGTDHNEIRVQADVARILPELVARFGQPFGNPTAVLTYALSQATRRYVKVALAGDGGDEVLCGYPRYQGIWLADLVQKAPASLRFGGRVLRALATDSSARGRPANRLRRFAENADRTSDEMYFRWVSYLDSARKGELLSDRAGLIGADAPSEEFEFLAAIRRRHATLLIRDAAQLIDLESFLPHNVLAYGDRMSMASALEVRVPFCDHVVVESLAPLPISTKMPAGIQKGLLRWAMRHDLPWRVLFHAKVGFNPPIAEWLRGPLAPMLDDLLSERSVRASELFAYSTLSQYLRRFRAGENGMAHSIWSIMVVEAWRRWLSAQGLSPASPA